MDRYVFVLSFCQRDDGQSKECLEIIKLIYDRLLDTSTLESSKGRPFPACSLYGSPAAQRWYFALQAYQGKTQFCSADWEELKTRIRNEDNEEKQPNTLELCLSCLSNQEAADENAEPPSQAELLEEAAEGLHSLSDKLPPPGKALLDVLVLGCTEEPPPVKDSLLLLGALKHMSCWHSAKITVVTQNPSRWHKVASYLDASVTDSAGLQGCVDHEEVWRGALVIREKKFVSELRFDGFSLRRPRPLNSSFLQAAAPAAAAASCVDQERLSEVFHYYTSALELVQLVSLVDLPGFLLSDTHFELGLTEESVRAKLLLDQLRSLRGKTAALFSLSCSVTAVPQPSAGQLSSQRWRESIARRRRSVPAPDVEVKGENAHYFLLVQGSHHPSSQACRVRLLHADGQINGAATMATVSNLLRVKAPASEGAARRILEPLRCLQGDEVLKRERKLSQVQTQVLQQYLREREETSGSPSVPVHELMAVLNAARKQYLEVIDSSLPSVSSCLTGQVGGATSEGSGCAAVCQLQSDWPESSVLLNAEKLQRRRQKRRFGLLGPGSSDSLLGPKDSQQKAAPAPLDARELLRHFTSEGQPAGELQPLAVSRGVLQLSGELSPGRLSRMSFRKASSSRYHGLEFCLDQQRSLDRDQALVRLQSRLLRCETQTTCSREPSALTFALSPAPSPAVASEPGSVPDGETLLQLHNADVARLKRRSRDREPPGGSAHKRLAKSESSDSLCSQSSSSSSSGPQRSGRSLRQQCTRSTSTSTCAAPAAPAAAAAATPAANRTSAELPAAGTLEPQQQDAAHSGPTEEKTTKESRSQKHNRMLLEVVAKTLKHHGIGAEHGCFQACSRRLFDISKFYLKDLKTSRGLYDEMKKAAGNNARQVIDWVLEKSSKM